MKYLLTLIFLAAGICAPLTAQTADSFPTPAEKSDKISFTTLFKGCRPIEGWHYSGQEIKTQKSLDAIFLMLGEKAPSVDFDRYAVIVVAEESYQNCAFGILESHVAALVSEPNCTKVNVERWSTVRREGQKYIEDDKSYNYFHVVATPKTDKPFCYSMREVKITNKSAIASEFSAPDDDTPDVPFTTLFKGCGSVTQNEIVETQKELMKYWPKSVGTYGTVPKAPRINFNKNVVIIGRVGGCESERVDVVDIKQTSPCMIVTIKFGAPGLQLAGFDIVEKYHIISVPKPTTPICLLYKRERIGVSFRDPAPQITITGKIQPDGKYTLNLKKEKKPLSAIELYTEPSHTLWAVVIDKAWPKTYWGESVANALKSVNPSAVFEVDFSQDYIQVVVEPPPQTDTSIKGVVMWNEPRNGLAGLEEKSININDFEVHYGEK